MCESKAAASDAPVYAGRRLVHGAARISRWIPHHDAGLPVCQVKQRGVRLVNIGGEDLVDGNRKLILGLTWSLILKFEIQKYGADEARLLKWARARAAEYGITITGWRQSFLDGLAFTALIHHHAPEVMDYVAPAPGVTVDFRAQLELAFSVAESRFGVPRLLDVEDLVSSSQEIDGDVRDIDRGNLPPGAMSPRITNLGFDERSVITYVAKLQQACKRACTCMHLHATVHACMHLHAHLHARLHYA